MARGFKEVNISNFSCQQRSQRYPNHDDLFDLLDFEDDLMLPNDDEESNLSHPPSIAEWRSNLVALSQRDNLYFAAYQDKIHATMPHGLKQILPGTPNLILTLPISREALNVGGYIDPSRPHCVNNMLVGNLGTHEILLMACDDGDIIAYYTHAIIACITSETRTESIKPFFHENVGSSAWGLATHEKSRLIAASSNLREVTVFMLAYTSPFDEEIEQVFLPNSIFSEVTQLTPSLSARRTSRKRILKLGPEGHNVPSLSFANDSLGTAQSILATDISGNLWIFDIYGDECQRVPSMHPNYTRGDRNMGWGVLVLPLYIFKHTETPHEALGDIRDLKSILSQQTVDHRTVKLFDISYSTSVLRDSRSPIFSDPDSLPPIRASPLVLEDDESEEQTADIDPKASTNDESEIRLLELLRRARSPNPPLLSTIQLFESSYSYSDAETSRNGGDKDSMTPEAVRNQRRDADTNAFQCLVNIRPGLLNAISTKEELYTILDKELEGESLGLMRRNHSKPKVAPFLRDGSAILRTYQFDVELLSPSPSIPRTICTKILKQSITQNMQEALRPFERLNLLTCIPPLSLVVVASQAGRVALLSLTRPEDRFSINGPVATFRVDHILPTREQEQAGFRPQLPLMGMAVSPLQMDGSCKETALRWRLIMHYYDHTVLSYELSRDGLTDDLIML